MYTRILNENSTEISGGGEVGQGVKAGLKHGGQGGIKTAHKHEEESRKRQVFSGLTQGGFTFLPHREVTPFAVENSDRLMYISVHDGSRSWCWDMQVNPRQYGCVTIKEDKTSRISVFLSNPEPHWFQENKENPSFPKDAVKVHQRSDHVVVYLAKVNWKHKLYPLALASLEAREHHREGVVYQDGKDLTGVWRENGKLCEASRRGLEISTLDLLRARKYEWVKAQRGNIMPPNAVKTTIEFGARERYVGRVGGEKISTVSITDGMISYFTDIYGFKTTSGDILLLTADPTV